MKSKGGISVIVVTTGGIKHRSIISLTGLSSISSVSIASDHKPNFKIKQNLPSSTSSFAENFDEPRMQGQPTMTMPAGIMPTIPPVSVSPHFPDTIKSTMRTYSGIDAV
jgi:hypothetical protein